MIPPAFVLIPQGFTEGTKELQPVLTPPTYEFDAFISYSRADLEWAQRLNADLKAQNITTFFAPDQRAGDEWQRVIPVALQKSQHLVIVWSEAVQMSDFVLSEVASFEMARLARLHANTDRQSNRQLIPLLLGRSKPLQTKYVAIEDLQDGKAHREGAKWIRDHETEWHSIVKRITESLRADNDATAITTAVLSMTLADVQELIQGRVKVGVGEPWVTMSKKLKMQSQHLANCYGGHRRDWKPFGKDENIGDVLDRLRASLETLAGGERFRLDYMPEAFWSPHAEEATLEAAKLGNGLSLLVIDPISLYDPMVRTRFEFLDRCFENPQAAIMLLAPFGPAERTTVLRDLIKDMASKVYTQFYEPTIKIKTKNASANFSLMTDDEVDVRRMMLTILRRRSTARQRTAGSPFLRVADS
jgi:hypothetical protein